MVRLPHNTALAVTLASLATARLALLAAKRTYYGKCLGPHLLRSAEISVV